MISIKQLTMAVLITSVIATLPIQVLADDVDKQSIAKLTQYDDASTATMDFTVVDHLLHAGVLNMGPSTRAYAKKSKHTLGTRFKQHVDGATENEANRFFYERLKKDQDKILKLRKELEALPTQTPLNAYNRKTQLAYWLNLYNVTVINEIASIYPLNNLKPILQGDDSILSKKLLMVEGTPLSLNDIQYRILPALYPESDLYIYGLYQGIKGSPNIRRKAYTSANVEKSLFDNATEFVNSNRGTQFNGGSDTVRVSSFYQRNANLFPNFEKDLKVHLQKYANNTIIEKVNNATSFKANISNWRVTDLYGSVTRRDYGTYVNTGDGLRFAGGSKLSQEQVEQLTSIMRIRAINFGGGSVTVTDLPSTESDKSTTTESSASDN
ncbi:DUF547 domain-containing protein [Thalassotalea sp. LPB0316]|uniref:DUF547 domain-containing protein n=1 Tax=Thalassotalea sp. LPB0316 TaxID=2769490 RepID=UPI0018684A7E|nr:DUF547 domain-containing protein [Thalassotalea sp. LPB0316]QOL24719.1 DUF547 domain-containing protein [Thalassotalea sp. LPB0316]